MENRSGSLRKAVPLSGGSLPLPGQCNSYIMTCTGKRNYLRMDNLGRTPQEEEGRLWTSRLPPDKQLNYVTGVSAILSICKDLPLCHLESGSVMVVLCPGPLRSLFDSVLLHFVGSIVVAFFQGPQEDLCYFHSLATACFVSPPLISSCHSPWSPSLSRSLSPCQFLSLSNSHFTLISEWASFLGPTILCPSHEMNSAMPLGDDSWPMSPVTH